MLYFVTVTHLFGCNSFCNTSFTKVPEKAKGFWLPLSSQFFKSTVRNLAFSFGGCTWSFLPLVNVPFFSTTLAEQVTVLLRTIHRQEPAYNNNSDINNNISKALYCKASTNVLLILKCCSLIFI